MQHNGGIVTLKHFRKISRQKLEWQKWKFDWTDECVTNVPFRAGSWTEHKSVSWCKYKLKSQKNFITQGKQFSQLLKFFFNARSHPSLAFSFKNVKPDHFMIREIILHKKKLAVTPGMSTQVQSVSSWCVCVWRVFYPAVKKVLLISKRPWKHTRLLLFHSFSLCVLLCSFNPFPWFTSIVSFIVVPLTRVVNILSVDVRSNYHFFIKKNKIKKWACGVCVPFLALLVPHQALINYTSDLWGGDDGFLWDGARFLPCCSFQFFSFR